MPKLDAALRRDQRKAKKRTGMQVTGRSIKSVLLPIIRKRSEAARKERDASQR